MVVDSRERKRSVYETNMTRMRDSLLHREKSLDHDLLPYGDPAGKDVLVFGSGRGSEVLWAARHGANSVVAIDLVRQSPESLQRAMQHMGISYTDFEFRQENVHDTALRGESYDLIVSNAVFEHVLDLKGVLASFRSLLKPGGRVAIFADGLWYSSIGGHVKRGPWEHLFSDPQDLAVELTPQRWDIYRNQLNRMTAEDFLEAIRSVGLLILQMRFGRDPYLSQLPDLLPHIQSRLAITPTDLSVVSVGCELCFVENLQRNPPQPHSPVRRAAV